MHWAKFGRFFLFIANWLIIMPDRFAFVKFLSLPQKAEYRYCNDSIYLLKLKFSFSTQQILS